MSRHSFQALIESPPPSPGLPSLLPHHGKKPSSRHLRYASHYLLKAVLAFLGLLITAWMFLAFFSSTDVRFSVSYLTYNGEAHKLVNTLPDDPTPVALTDHRGRTKWTVYIPQDEGFPLEPSVYAEVCSQSEDLAVHILDAAGHSRLHAQKDRSGYYHVDRNFIDVQEAEQYGLIPKTKADSQTRGWTETVSEMYTSQIAETKVMEDEVKVCGKSLTYVMETTDAGFGTTIMGLWMAYGLAQREHRSFFVDDRNWAYGKYTAFFQAPPSPSCQPPPDNHRLPCPHHARHLLVSTSTFPWTFGYEFNEYFKDTRKANVLQQRDAFALLRTGYEALFRLAKSDADYLEKRVSDLRATLHGGDGHDGLMVGVHVRHGDHHPWEYQYQQSYLPLGKYTDAAKALILDVSTAKNGSVDPIISEASRIVLASDDPEVYASPTFSSALRAQEQILLASKAAFPQTQQPQGAIHKFVDENTGWEGGFFKDVFWSLGTPAMRLQARSVSTDTMRDELPSELALQLRGFLGRSYLLDLAVVGQADRVVCAVSSVTCRLLAVMVGWEKGVVQRRWMNVDGGYEWVGIT